MMMVLSIRRRMTETLIERGSLDHDRVLIPHAGIVIGARVLCIEDAHTIAPHTDMSQRRRCERAGILLRMTVDLKDKILILRRIRIAGPRPDIVTRNAGA